MKGRGRSSPGSYRVLRGGSWNNNHNNLRSANRNRNNPTNTNNNNGFRVSNDSHKGPLNYPDQARKYRSDASVLRASGNPRPVSCGHSSGPNQEGPGNGW
ncbi:SUMF1/EgtB/PvdO family nonheme iron enzyme [Candidatus Hydrogenedentota bacterium]